MSTGYVKPHMDPPINQNTGLPMTPKEWERDVSQRMHTVGVDLVEMLAAPITPPRGGWKNHKLKYNEP